MRQRNFKRFGWTGHTHREGPSSRVGFRLFSKASQFNLRSIRQTSGDLNKTLDRGSFAASGKVSEGVVLSTLSSRTFRDEDRTQRQILQWSPSQLRQCTHQPQRSQQHLQRPAKVRSNKDIERNNPCCRTHPGQVVGPSASRRTFSQLVHKLGNFHFSDGYFQLEKRRLHRVHWVSWKFLQQANE